MTDDRRRHSDASLLDRARTQRSASSATLAAAATARGKSPIVAPEPRRSLHCEIDGLPSEVETAELSGAGMFVLTPQPLSIDSEVSVFLRIDQQRFEMTGHVVTSVSCDQASESGKKPGYALLFTNLSEDERKALSVAARNLRAASAPPRAPSTSPATKPSRASVARFEPPALADKRAGDDARYDPMELALLGRLRGELSELEDKTPWAVLGVSQGAEPSTIKAAFFQASKRYHPHLYARYRHPEIKRVVTNLFIAHKRAYTTMTKVKKSSRTGRP